MIRSLLPSLLLPALLLVQSRPAFTYDQGGITRGDISRKQIALIFTGGEYGEGAVPILDALKAEGVPASFFVTGDFLQDPVRVAALQRAVAEGHYLGPHSDKHPLYCAWEDRRKTLVTEEQFRTDLAKNIADLKALGAQDPVYFIPPYEYFNADQVKWAKSMNVTLFNFTPGSGSNRDYIPESDPKFKPSADILKDILAYEQKDPHGLNGFLLLLHLGSARQDKMHPQLQPLIQQLKARGYTFVRVDALLSP